MRPPRRTGTPSSATSRRHQADSGAEALATRLASLAFFSFPRCLPNGLVIVGRVKLGAEGTPGAVFDRQVHFAQPVHGHAEGNHLSDAHHHVPGDDLDALRWELLIETRLLQLGLDF